MRDLLPPDRAALILAPMQDVTDLPFMRILARRGAPDWFVTEYFRVHPNSQLNAYILRSIMENETNRPIFAQMIGRDLPSLLSTVGKLSALPIAGIDLNLGCPAPVVCRNNAGGGLLREPESVNRLLGMLREAIPGRFTVKTRIGYTSEEEFPALLEVFRKHGIDGLAIHGRTVIERYQTPVHPDPVRLATEVMPCPVIANGNIVDVSTALAFLEKSGAAGLMIGRGAIRNPWIFSQCAAALTGGDPPKPSHRDLLEYVMELYDELGAECPRFEPKLHVQRMKKTLAYITHGLEGGTFEHDMRRATEPDEFVEICRRHLDHDAPLPARPPQGSKLFCGFEDLLR